MYKDAHITPSRRTYSISISLYICTLHGCIVHVHTYVYTYTGGIVYVLVPFFFTIFFFSFILFF